MKLSSGPAGVPRAPRVHHQLGLPLEPSDRLERQLAGAVGLRSLSCLFRSYRGHKSLASEESAPQALLRPFLPEQGPSTG